MMILLFPVENDRNTGREALVRNCVLACLSTPKRKITDRSVNSCVSFLNCNANIFVAFLFLNSKRSYGFMDFLSVFH